MSWYKSIDEFVSDKMGGHCKEGVNYFEAYRLCIEDVYLVYRTIPPFEEFSAVWQATVLLDGMQNDYMENARRR